MKYKPNSWDYISLICWAVLITASVMAIIESWFPDETIRSITSTLNGIFLLILAFGSSIKADLKNIQNGLERKADSS